jgi:hypothetical protein
MIVHNVWKILSVYSCLFLALGLANGLGRILHHGRNQAEIRRKYLPSPAVLLSARIEDPPGEVALRCAEGKSCWTTVVILTFELYWGRVSATLWSWAVAIGILFQAGEQRMEGRTLCQEAEYAARWCLQ